MGAVLVTAMIAIATIAGVVLDRFEKDSNPQNRGVLARSIAYWLFTIIVAFELAAGALWDLLRIEYVRVILTHLGYPLYLLTILGVWKILGAAAILAPRFQRLKEWAYAGAFFSYTGAAASHLLAGDRVPMWAAPLVFSAFTIGSWALRPASRRLPAPTPARETRTGQWVVPILTVVAMLVVAFVTLPKGPPPQ